jgi:hypothetical protein
MLLLKHLDNSLVCPAIKTNTLMKQQKFVQQLHLVLAQSTPCLHFKNVFLAITQMLQVSVQMAKLIVSHALKEPLVAVRRHPLLVLLVLKGTGVQLWMRTYPRFENIHVLQEPKQMLELAFQRWNLHAQFVLQEIIAMEVILQKLLVPQVTSAQLVQNGQLNSHA